jgi:hypothetical protein
LESFFEYNHLIAFDRSGLTGAPPFTDPKLTPPNYKVKGIVHSQDSSQCYSGFFDNKSSSPLLNLCQKPVPEKLQGKKGAIENSPSKLVFCPRNSPKKG